MLDEWEANHRPPPNGCQHVKGAVRELIRTNEPALNHQSDNVRISKSEHDVEPWRRVGVLSG